MRAFLTKRWFLLVLTGGLALAGWRPDWLRWTGRLDLRLLVGLALFLMAWCLPGRSLARALARPGPVLWAIVISYGALPALAWCAGRLLEPDYRVGLLVFASVPCTLASATLWTRMAGGNEAVALLVTLLTTSTSWLATTAWLVLGTGTAVEVNPTGLMRDLALVLVLPVGLGQLARTAGPLARAATRGRAVLGVLSRLLMLVVILKAAADVSGRLGERAAALAAGPLLAAAGLCVATHLAALAAGLWGARALRFDRPSRVAVAFACSQKSLPVGLFLFDAYFKDLYPLAVVPMVFYHVGQLVVDTFIADALAGPAPGLTAAGPGRIPNLPEPPQPRRSLP
jgi:sodium/bile acid cotransporter 7